ncbi:MAG TPA: MBL fold metallo-hydrolase [Actinomycetes bacterium]|nr:MBL fold metallo-hydrolase [Actinomycetes bacterium]
MPVWICATCANHYPEAPSPPGACIICADERQWVPATGQRWTTAEELAAAGHRADVREVEPGLLGIGVDPPVAIGQRALLVRTAEGNLLWDPPGYLDEAAVEAVTEAGGLRAVTASHPHFYGSMAGWSSAFDADVLVPEADLGWLTHPPARPPVTWSGSLAVLPGVTLVQCGGHFAGSAVVHWAAGAGGAGALLSGDTIFVTPGEDRVTFVRSAPNRLPLPERAVRAVVEAVRPYRYDRIYGGWWQPVLRRDAKAVVERSAERYIQWLRGEAAQDP